MQIVRLLAGLFVVLFVFEAAHARAYKVDRESGTVTVTSLADYDKCQATDAYGDACLEALKAYVAKQPKDAFAAGKRARANYNHWVALGFFDKAFVKAPTPEQCADPDVAMAVVSGLALPSDDPSTAIARKIAGAQCWTQVRAAVLAELAEATSYYKANACPLLVDKQQAAAACQPAKPAAESPAESASTAQLKGVNWKQLPFEASSARALRGRRGEEVLMVRAKPDSRGLVLLKFKSIEGPWNDQVLVALERQGGRGTDYVTLVDGSEWVAVTERDREYEAYPKGVRDPIGLFDVVLERGAKQKPTVADIASEFGGPKPTATPKKK